MKYPLDRIENNIDPQEIFASYDCGRKIRMILEVHPILSEKERMVISRCFGLLGDMEKEETFQAIAKTESMSPRTVHNIQKTALQKLRSVLDTCGISKEDVFV